MAQWQFTDKIKKIFEPWFNSGQQRSLEEFRDGIKVVTDDLQNQVDTVSGGLAGHLADPTDAHDASAISNVPAGTIIAVDVQAAINELDTDIQGHITDSLGAHAASAVSYTPTGGLAATELQGAVDELESEKVAFTRLDDADGSTLVGFIQSGAGASPRTTQDKLRESVSVLDYGAVGDGVTNDTAAFLAAIATGKAVYVPRSSASYRVHDMLSLNNGQTMFGDGRTASMITVDAATFNMAALGVIRLGTGEPGASLFDIGIDLVQDSAVSARASVNQYPWAIYAVGAARFQIDRVRISRAWDGVNATGNTGGAYIGRLEVGALNKGLQIDGALDFFHIGSYHFWPFGMSSGNIFTGVYSDGTTVAIDLGQCDGLNAALISSFKGIVNCTGGAPSTISRTIACLQLDGDGARLVYDGRDLQIGQVYTTKSAGSLPTIAVSSGRLFIGQYRAITAGDTGITVSGGSLQINGGFISQGSVSTRAAYVTGGRLELRNMRWEIPATVRVTPYVEQSGAGVLIAEHNTCAELGANGPAIAIGQDNGENVVQGNSTGAWTITLPASASIGTYGPNKSARRTFTPTVVFTTNGDFAPTYTAQNGHYHYVSGGVWVWISVTFDANAYTTATGQLRIAGLPVTAASFFDGLPMQVAGHSKVNLATGYTQLGALLRTGGQISFLESGDNLVGAAIGTAHVPASQTGVNLVVSGFIPTR